MFTTADCLWKKKNSENDLYEVVSAYIFRIYRYMQDKENILSVMLNLH